MKAKLSILMFLQFFMWSSWYVSGGTYMIQTLGFSGTQVGLIYGSFAIAGLISPFISGILADRFFSTEKLLAFFHLLGGCLLIAVSFFEDFSWIYLLILIYNFLYVPTTALSSSITFHHIEDRQRDFAPIRVWGTIGWVVAGFCVGILAWETTHYPWWLAGVSSIVTGIFCFFLPKTPPSATAKRRSLKALLSGGSGDLLRNRAFGVFIIGITLIRIPASFYYSFVNPYLYEIGVPNPTGKMALGQLAEILLVLTVPFVLRRIGLKRLLVLGMFAWGFRYLLFALGSADTGMWLIYLAIILHSVTYTYTSLVGQIYVDESVPIELRASAQGFMVFLTTGFGPLIGAYLAGGIVEHYTLADGSHYWWGIFLVPAIIGIATSVGFALGFRPNKNKVQV